MRTRRGFVTCLTAAVLFLLMVGGTSPGQTVITYADFLNAHRAGTTSINTMTPLNQQVTLNIGKPSMNPQSWDFSGLDFSRRGYNAYVDPSTTPFAGSFPTATIARKTVTEGAEDAFFQYFQLSSNGLRLLGWAEEDDSGATRFDPAVCQLKLPCGFGSSWTYSGTPTTPMPGVTITTEHYFVVDAVGTMKMPDGDHDVIRLRCETTTDTRTPTGSSLTRMYTFSFLTTGLTALTFVMDTAQEALTTVTVVNVGCEAPGSPSFVERRSALPGGTMAEVYPNPVRSGEPAAMRYHAAGAVNARLLVFDNLGRMVQERTGPEDTGPEGIVPIQTTGLPAGIYHCCLLTDRVTATAIFTVLR